jgi:hypothetical protein
MKRKRCKREEVLIEVGAWIAVLVIIGWVVVQWN